MQCFDLWESAIVDQSVTFRKRVCTGLIRGPRFRLIAMLSCTKFLLFHLVDHINNIILIIQDVPKKYYGLTKYQTIVFCLIV